MTRTATLVVVNYRTSPLAINAIDTARKSISSPLQVIAVDNSVDPAEAAALRPHADIVLSPDRNLGYAAAINLARPHCNGETIIVANPDVIFGKNAIDILLDADAAVAGPAFFWDDQYEWMLPGAELQSGWEVLDRVVASRSNIWARMRDRRRIAKRLSFWSLNDITEVDALSGSVLAIRTKAFDRAGGFDERFPLYFEENDFLRRVEGRIVYVPKAKCRHIYNQSAGASPEASALYALSERAYLEKWNGRAIATMLKNFERPPREVDATNIGNKPIPAPANSVIEACPQPSFEMVAGHFPRAATVVVPPSIWDSYRDPVLYLRVVDRASRSVLATYARTKI